MPLLRQDKESGLSARIIFLDIDGVLNSTRTCIATGGYPGEELEDKDLARFDWIAIGLLRRLCESSGIQIVLSSSWRIIVDIKKLGDAMGLPIIDKTPVLASSRGNEIARWLSEHPEVGQWAIIDDDSDMLDSQRSRFVRTDGHEGYSWVNHLELCDIFGELPYSGEAVTRGQFVIL